MNRASLMRALPVAACLVSGTARGQSLSERVEKGRTVFDLSPYVFPRQILGVRQLRIVQVHLSLGRRDVRMPQKPTGKFDSLHPAGFRSAPVPGQVQKTLFR
jgi:hypothetical protein